MKFSRQEIECVAKAMKVLRLADMPGMDAVAVRLNCEPAYAELKEAERWAVAFEHAQQLRPFDLAARVREVVT
jgi:hypothetical protein